MRSGRFCRSCLTTPRSALRLLLFLLPRCLPLKSRTPQSPRASPATMCLMGQRTCAFPPAEFLLWATMIGSFHSAVR